MDFISKSEETKTTDDHQERTYAPFCVSRRQGDVIHCQTSYEMDPAASSKFDELEATAGPVIISGECPNEDLPKFDVPSLGEFNAEPGVGDGHYAKPLTGFGASPLDEVKFSDEPLEGFKSAEAVAGGYRNNDGFAKFNPSEGGFNAEPGVGDGNFAKPLTGFGASPVDDEVKFTDQPVKLRYDYSNKAAVGEDFAAEAGAGGNPIDDGFVKFNPSEGGFNAESGVGDENYAKPLTGLGRE